MKLNKIIQLINSCYDERASYDWDNSGLQIGSMHDEINKAVICVDVNDFVAEEAVKNGAQLIISHHPLLFSPIKRITDSPKEKLIKKLIKNDICVYSSHTCFDASPNGFNRYVSNKLGMTDCKMLENNIIEGYGIGVSGKLKDGISFGHLVRRVKEIFGCETVKTSVCGDFTVNRVAFCSGSGSEFISAASDAKAEVLITADCKNSAFLHAVEKNVALICPTHFESEYAFIDIIISALSDKLSGVELIASEARDVEVYM